MEYFDEPLELASKGSHDAMVAVIEKNLAAKKYGATKVYKIDIPGTSQTLIGVAMKASEGAKANKYMDDTFIMGDIAFTLLLSTSHLPYETTAIAKDPEA